MKLKIIDGNKPDKEPEIKWNDDHDDLQRHGVYMDKSGFVFGVGRREPLLKKEYIKPIFGRLTENISSDLADDRSFARHYIQLPAEAISLTIDLSKLPPEVAEWIRENSNQ